jgi:hypothetical protein
MGRDSRAGRSKRMAERDRSAAEVQLFARQ